MQLAGAARSLQNHVFVHRPWMPPIVSILEHGDGSESDCGQLASLSVHCSPSLPVMATLPESDLLSASSQSLTVQLPLTLPNNSGYSGVTTQALYWRSATPVLNRSIAQITGSTLYATSATAPLPSALTTPPQPSPCQASKEALRRLPSPSRPLPYRVLSSIVLSPSYLEHSDVLSEKLISDHISACSDVHTLHEAPTLPLSSVALDLSKSPTAHYNSADEEDDSDTASFIFEASQSSIREVIAERLEIALTDSLVIPMPCAGESALCLDVPTVSDVPSLEMATQQNGPPPSPLGVCTDIIRRQSRSPLIPPSILDITTPTQVDEEVPSIDEPFTHNSQPKLNLLSSPKQPNDMHIHLLECNDDSVHIDSSHATYDNDLSLVEPSRESPIGLDTATHSIPVEIESKSPVIENNMSIASSSIKEKTITPFNFIPKAVFARPFSDLLAMPSEFNSPMDDYAIPPLSYYEVFTQYNYNSIKDINVDKISNDLYPTLENQSDIVNSVAYSAEDVHALLDNDDSSLSDISDISSHMSSFSEQNDPSPHKKYKVSPIQRRSKQKVLPEFDLLSSLFESSITKESKNSGGKRKRNTTKSTSLEGDLNSTSEIIIPHSPPSLDNVHIHAVRSVPVGQSDGHQTARLVMDSVRLPLQQQQKRSSGSFRSQTSNRSSNALHPANTITGKLRAFVLSVSGIGEEGEQLKSIVHPILSKLGKMNLFDTSVSFVEGFNFDVTHIVVHEDENRCVVRTKKYIGACLHGLWIVDVAWLRTCLSAKKMLDEHEYEVLGDRTGGASHGPTLNREHKHQLRYFQTKTRLHLVSQNKLASFLRDNLSHVGYTVLDTLPPIHQRSRVSNNTPYFTIEHAKKLTFSLDFTLPVIIADAEQLANTGRQSLRQCQVLLFPTLLRLICSGISIQLFVETDAQVISSMKSLLKQ